MGRDQDQQGDADQQSRQPDMIEWVIGGVSGVLVAAMIGFVLYEAFTTTRSGPVIAISVETIEATMAGHRVEFRATNLGDATAAGVKIEGTLDRDGQTIETVDVTLDYVPAHSERGGGMFFERDPSQYELTLQARSYNIP